MALNTREITIEGGSDDGKTFVVTQMPLMRGDKWSNRVKLALLRSGIDVSGLGLEKIISDKKFTGLLDVSRFINVALKALGGMQDKEAQELLDELVRGSNLKFKLPDGNLRDAMLPMNDESSSDITDPKALWDIRMACIKVNYDFLKAGVM